MMDVASIRLGSLPTFAAHAPTSMHLNGLRMASVRTLLPLVCNRVFNPIEAITTSDVTKFPYIKAKAQEHLNEIFHT